MAKYLKTDYVPEGCEYLTAGKEYLVTYTDGRGLRFIVDDQSDEIPVPLSRQSQHLDDGRAWTVINR